jgi:hypothetical protein
LRPILAAKPWERFQIDLMDTTKTPDAEYNWILHIVDHLTKYTVAFPLRRKTSDEVALNMALFISALEFQKLFNQTVEANFEVFSKYFSSVMVV